MCNPLKKLHKEIYSKTLWINQNGIPKNVQVIYRKAGKRAVENKDNTQKPNNNVLKRMLSIRNQVQI